MAVLGIAAAEFVVLVAKAVAQGSTLGVDFHYYLGYTTQWLQSGHFYAARQLAGPYVLMPGDSLYPPTAVYLFLPFALVNALWPLWWIVPVVTTAVAVARLRPRPWTWPVLALIIAWPRTIEITLYGNPTMWMTAATAVALFWGWPAALMVLKPSLAPFALIGIRRRSWWIALGWVTLLTLPLVPEWLQYPGVLINAQESGGVMYSLRDVPLMLAPLLAWAASGNRRRLTWPDPRALVSRTVGLRSANVRGAS